ncbi:MFS transporter [Komagataeibacter intermedius]|uniref:Major facilitator superfamily protein n=2 Tax=Komagataeibacter intermedius TaxID=66229 RepID=A0A0N0MGI6_9PROT|nr:MFS transporter [Komagataeibacter intermedius]KPH87964.1 major facilitator superfamily protein [Komagataeibacter intermedius AF2]GAN86459.1 major facilitator superfamily transporter [Komagataeibacter intermedius TF2]
MNAAIDRPVARRNVRSAMLIAFCYASIVLSMTSVGIFVSFVVEIGRDLHISRAQAGMALSIYSIPAALACMPIGRLIDRIGIRYGMVLAGILAALGNIFLAGASDPEMLYGGMALEGTAFGCMAVACPSALVSWLDGNLRTRALSFWSTYGPVGYACGLLLAVPFATGTHWRQSFAWDGGIFCVLIVLAFWLPAQSAIVEVRSLRAGLKLFLLDRAVPRLALALALPNAVAYGVSVVTPSYLEHLYGLSLKVSNGGVAGAKILAMVCGGVLTGYLLIRKVDFRNLYRLLVVMGIFAILVLFFPYGTFPIALLGLVMWLLAFGGLVGSATAQLPLLVTSPGDIGLASGIIGQITSFVCLLAPPVFLAISQWNILWGLASVTLLLAAWLVPGGRTGLASQTGIGTHSPDRTSPILHEEKRT